MLTQAEVEYKQNCTNFVHVKKLYAETDFPEDHSFCFMENFYFNLCQRDDTLYIVSPFNLVT